MTMKKSSVLLIAAILMLVSCGTVAQYASSDNGQKYNDGIYTSTPSFMTKAEKEEARNEAQALVEKTQASQIYLFGDKKDTVMIPQDMSAMIRYDQKLGGTVVTVGENPYDWRYDLENNYGYYYGPYSIGSSWYWSRHYSPWYWNSWTYSPWRYHGWYDPFYIGGWYDPWYYSGWYDPWYYGGWWGWYDPWYHHHHYCGWYGGWDPYWGHHHHGHGPGYVPEKPGHDNNTMDGPRRRVGSDRVFSGSSSVRGGVGNRISSGNGGTVSGRVATRKASGTSAVSSGRVSSTDRVTSAARTSIVRTTPSVRGNSNNRPAASTNAGTSSQPNHRKPTISTDRNTHTGTTIYRGSSSSTTSDRQSGYQRGSSPSRSSSSYERGSSSYERSSSSYNRSSTPSSGRSSFGGGGGSSMSRSSSGGGSSYSRSGGARR